MANTKPTSKPETDAKPATAVAKPNARQHLRDLFKNEGDVATKEQVFGDYYKVTIQTHLTDLKNPTYAGKAGCLNIVKMNDGTYKRLPLDKKQEAKKA